MDVRTRFSPQLQWLMTALCLLASLAYSVRTVPVPDEPRLSLGSAHHSARHEHGAPHESPPAHEAHCPFCLTAGFALEPSAVSAPASEAVLAPRGSGRPVHIHLAPLRHGDARAPPLT